MRLLLSAIIIAFFMSFLPSVLSAQVSQPEILEFKLEIEGIGELILVQTNVDQTETAQLILKKPGGLREVIESFDGLLPSDLIKHDLDGDGIDEIMALLRHPDGVDVLPFLFSLKNGLTKIYPEKEQDDNMLICREIFISSFAGKPVLCARNLVAFHDFGPPDLYKLDYYSLERDKLSLLNQGLSDGTHFNIFMNKGAMAFHTGQFLEAIDFYNQAIASSTGNLSSRAFIECIFYLAESRKFVKDFNGALEYYQKIVLEFGQNNFTDAAQREIELISENLDNLNELSFYIDVLSLISIDKWDMAINLLDNMPDAARNGALQDRFMYTRGETLIALNRIEEAIEVFEKIKSSFPESPLIESIDTILADMEAGPEDTDGL